ncbi:CBL-interacting serine/threonine-protein kinase 1 isoform X2 [Tanacetum coccineum]
MRSCGVILYVILTGYLPFDDRNLDLLLSEGMHNPMDSDRGPHSPKHRNAFGLIGISSSLDLSGFFEKESKSVE